MEQGYSQKFELGSRALYYDCIKAILLCKDSKSGKNIWIKKISDISRLDTVIEDSSRYYIACETDDIKGYYLAINRETGSTEWFIPGKAYFHIVYNGGLYIIFTDEKSEFYMLRVDCSDGTKIWHRRIDNDLCEYTFSGDRIVLTFGSGKQEKISSLTGIAIH